jgi:FdhD protein
MSTTEQPATRGTVGTTRVTVVENGEAFSRRDRIVTEEPFEIRAAGPDQAPLSVAVTMRTPGADMELAAGFLFTEGLVSSREEIDRIRYCGLEAGQEQDYNVATVHLRRLFDAGSLQRNFYATSSCGVCGKASIDQVEVRCPAVSGGPVVPRLMVETLVDRLRASQRVFDKTGGLHAAGLFEPDGTLVVSREDVGRHNAMDKLVGHELLAGRVPAADRIVVVSGRASFELVQKAAVAGIPIFCAVSAPSTLALDAARRLGLTLIGFLRQDRFTIYCHPERIDLS